MPNEHQLKSQLIRILLLLLRQGEFTPGDLRNLRLGIKKSVVYTTKNVSPFEALRVVEKKLEMRTKKYRRKLSQRLSIRLARSLRSNKAS